MAADDVLARGIAVVRGVQRDAQSRFSGNAPRAARAVEAVPDGSVAVTGEVPPSVFISWAHSGRGWDEIQTREWQAAVATLATVLRRQFGIDADVDLFHLDEAIDWTRYGQAGVRNADSTLIVVSEAWAERWSGDNDPTVGAGAAVEADTLKGLFVQNQQEWQRRTVLVLLPDVDPGVVPPDLQRVVRVSLDPTDPDSYSGLVRLLTKQPTYEKPPLGGIPAMPARIPHRDLAELRRDLDQVSAESSAATGDTRAALREALLRGLIDADGLVNS